MSSLQRDAKLYGAVESESYITFTGFCKRIYDTTQQSVDVFIDDQKVTTLIADQKLPDIENKYEVFDTNGFCFTYTLPKEYIGQKHKLEFKTQEGEQLLHSPTHTLDKFSPLYNQAMFIESLNQLTQYDVIKEGYTKNALSFIAIEENLNDEAFIEFVLEMCKLYKELTLNIVYFNEHQKNQATKLLSQVKNKTFFNPSSVKELIKNSEIYLHNVVEEFRFTINEEYYKKVKNQTVIKENLFMLELTRKAKKKKDMSEVLVDTITPILFETSVIAEIFKDDERYNEFSFVNSLSQPMDVENIKNLHSKDAIGFLASDTNLESDKYTNYMKELYKRFPQITFKLFYFYERDKEKLQNIFKQELDRCMFVEPKNSCDILKEIEIMVDNRTYEELFKIIRRSNKVFYVGDVLSGDIKKHDMLSLNFFNQFKNTFDISAKDIQEVEESFTRFIYEKTYNNITNKCYKIDVLSSAYEFYGFTRIDWILNQKGYKEELLSKVFQKLL